jgi:hypothetical protein
MIVVEDNRIIEAKHACILGSAKILGHCRLGEKNIGTHRKNTCHIKEASSLWLGFRVM